LKLWLSASQFRCLLNFFWRQSHKDYIAVTLVVEGMCEPLIREGHLIPASRRAEDSTFCWSRVSITSATLEMAKDVTGAEVLAIMNLSSVLEQ
jgi:hypothetical protein